MRSENPEQQMRDHRHKPGPLEALKELQLSCVHQGGENPSLPGGRGKRLFSEGLSCFGPERSAYERTHQESWIPGKLEDLGPSEADARLDGRSWTFSEGLVVMVRSKAFCVWTN